MAIDTHIKFDGVEGESTHVDHKGEVRILSWTWGVSNASLTSGGFVVTVLVHTDMASPHLHHAGSAAQKAKYLPRLISGEHVGALAMSEPGAGSDVISMKLKAEDKGGYYLLNGSKMWITNGPDADTLVVYAKTEPELGARGVTAFIVDAKSPGITLGKIEEKMGIKASDTRAVFFENVVVPVENRLTALEALRQRIAQFNPSAGIIECIHSPLYLEDVFTGGRAGLELFQGRRIASLSGRSERTVRQHAVEVLIVSHVGGFGVGAVVSGVGPVVKLQVVSCSMGVPPVSRTASQRGTRGARVSRRSANAPSCRVVAEMTAMSSPRTSHSSTRRIRTSQWGFASGAGAKIAGDQRA